MILLLITLILWTLKIFGVISWSYWIVFAPLLLEGAFSSFLFVKTEIEYMVQYNKDKKEEPAEE